MLRKMGGAPEEVAWVAEDTRLAASNYQRRAPCLVVNILRGKHLDAATGGMSVVDLEVPLAGEFEGNGVATRTRVVKASGLRTYSRNALKLAREDSQDLIMSLAGEMNDAGVV